jgi:Alkylmercury lyase
MTEDSTMDFDTTVKLAIYRATADSGALPSLDQVAARVAAAPSAVRQAYQRLAASRLLVLEPDGAAIRMAPPFSGVATQHRVTVGEVTYHANCAWDALGIPAALHRPGLVRSKCGQSGEPLRLAIGLEGPEPSSWLFHCQVPAARWWQDIVFT